MHPPTPVANGVRTDHPIPGLPFMDDSVLDLGDRAAIEAIGRGTRDGMWGRTDLYNMVPGAWRAFTTDPHNPEYAWVVINHPENGRTVTLYQDEDAASAYSYRDYDNGGIIPLIVRAGGYWSDGEEWRRPTAKRDPVAGGQVWDAPEGATMWTAVDARLDPLPGEEMSLLDLSVRNVQGGLPVVSDGSLWRITELKAWEAARQGSDATLPTGRCVVDLIARELTGTSLLASPDAAEVAGVGASTWRAYVARGSAPAPQRIRSGRPYWSRPILDAYVAREKRDVLRPVGDLPEGNASMTVDRIREDIYRAGRKSFKPMQSTALRNALSGQIIGLSSNNYVTESMHAAWILHEYEDAKKSGARGVSSLVIDQIEGLAWLNRHSAQSAISQYVAWGIEAGHERVDLEDALFGAVMSEATRTLIEEAITPEWC